MLSETRFISCLCSEGLENDWLLVVAARIVCCFPREEMGLNRSPLLTGRFMYQREGPWLQLQSTPQTPSQGEAREFLVSYIKLAGALRASGWCGSHVTSPCIQGLPTLLSYLPQPISSSSSCLHPHGHKRAAKMQIFHP